MTVFKDIVEGRDKKNFLGVIKGEIQLAASKPGFEGDTTVLAIVKKMEKSLIETNTDESKRELEFLKPYLPTMMSESEVRSIVEKLVENGANNIGAIMKEFNSTYKGLADNKVVKEVSTEILALC